MDLDPVARGKAPTSFHRMTQGYNKPVKDVTNLCSQGWARTLLSLQCGSRSQAGWHMVWGAGGSNKPQSIQFLPWDGKSQLLPCLCCHASGGWQNSGRSRGVPESSLSIRMFNVPEHFCALFVFPVAVPWPESGEFLACLLFHLCYILSLSLLGWVSGPQRSAALISFSSSAHLARMCPCPIG